MSIGVAIAYSVYIEHFHIQLFIINFNPSNVDHHASA